jgi:hypothetical protein
MSGSTNSGTFLAAIRQGGLKIEFDLTSSGTLNMETLGQARMYNVEFSEKAGTNIGSRFTMGLSQSTTWMFHSCLFKFLNPRATLPAGYGLITIAANGYVEFVDCDMQWNLTGSQSSVDTASVIGSAANFNGIVKFTRNRFTTNGSGTSGGPLLKWFSTVVNNNTSIQQYILEDNSGIRLGSAAAGFQLPFPNSSRFLTSTSLIHRTAEQGRSFRVETQNGIAEWDYTGNYTYLAATQPGNIPYSVRMDWFNNGCVTPVTPFTSPKMTKLNRLATGNRTVTLEMLLDSTRVVDSYQMGICVSYTDSTGIPRREATYMNTAPSTSTAPWTIPGVWSAYTPKKLTINTTRQV